MFAGAEARAALMEAAVTVPPETAAHCDVTHCVRVVEIVAPAFDQLIARLGLRMPDQAWPCKDPQRKMKVANTTGQRLNVNINSSSGGTQYCPLP